MRRPPGRAERPRIAYIRRWPAHDGNHWYTGPLTGPRGEIPPTDRPLNLDFSDLFETEASASPATASTPTRSSS